MDFKQFLNIVHRRWLTIVLVIALSLGVAGVIIWRSTPMYESKARIFISVDLRNAAEATGALYFTVARVQSYADLADSTDLMNTVIADLDLNLTPEQLADQISAEVIRDTTIIELSVRDPDPDQALAIARTHSQRLTEYLSDLETPRGSGTTQIVASVTDSPTYNGDAVTPRTWLYLGVAALIGLFVGIAAAVARQLFDRTITSQDHLQEISDKPVLASVGFDKSIRKSPLLTDLGSFAPRTEAFRVLRTNLQFLDLDRQPRCLVISSAVQGEGKTMMSTNLGIALAQTGRRTLIIDGDLRRPRVASQLKLDGAIGLTTVLLGRATAQEAIQVHEPSGLHVLASGAKPPNPTEILQSRVTQTLVKELTDEYDMVIIDGPPLLPVADASVLSTLADGTILVLHHGKTTTDAVEQAIKRLEQVGGRLFGLVVNMIPRRATGSYYYYYYEEQPRAAARGGRRDVRESRRSDDKDRSSVEAR